MTDWFLFLVAIVIYNLYWRWLSRETRFIRRNKLL